MKKTKRLMSIFLAIVMCVTSLVPFVDNVSAADTPTSVVVDVTKTYQTIRGFGGINLPEWITQGDLTDAQRKKAFGNGDDELGLSMLRIYVSDDKNSWSKAVPTAKYAQNAGATVFATPWNPPSSMREAGGGGFQTGLYHLPSSSYSAYAKHLNDYYTYMKNNGVNVYAISVQNEPDYSKEWTGWTSDETTSFLANYGDQLNFRVISPETFQYANKDYYNKILNNSKAFANTDIFATHFYGTQRSQMDFPALESAGKEIWMTEVYVPNSDADSADRWPEAIKVSENMHNGLVVGNMSAYVWWYIRRSYGLIKEDGSISKRGYCFAQYSKFVRPGYRRIEATEQPASGVYVSAYRGDDNKVVIVAVNEGSDSYSQYFDLKGQNIKNVDRYRTKEDENLAKTAGMAASNGGFYAYLPSNSVSTFVVTVDDGQAKSDPNFVPGSAVYGESSNPSGNTVTAATVEDGWYYIKNVGTQKYLQVENNTGADGTNVEVGDGTGAAGQKWHVTNLGNGYVNIENALGYNLDIKYGEKNDGTNIQTYSSNGADAQVFKFVTTSKSGVYGITTKITKDEKALDVNSSSSSNVAQYSYTASSTQQWKLEATSYTGGGTQGGTGDSGSTDTKDATLLNTYGKLFGYSGTCINMDQLRDASTLAFLKKHYNSITLENEMKPDSILRAYSKQLITVAEAKQLGYYIPSNYTDAYVPKLNFASVDEAMKICYENGIKMRAHTLVWHSQTPTFFFRSNYDNNGSYVSKSVMDARMEFYIVNVMNHVYDSKYGSVVYVWDVVNEYLNARTSDKSDWVKVYGEQGTKPDFVKKAFTIANKVLVDRGLRNKISLLYNDFNTYMNQDDVVALINYVNTDGKVCDGVGMQSHLGTDFPSASYYKQALTKFKNAGFEIQITELDVTNLKNYDQPQYYYDICKAILDTKKAGGNITGFTLWGLWDSVSWIKTFEGKENCEPLLFTGIDKPKEEFNRVIKAYTDAGYTIGSNTSGTEPTITVPSGYTKLDLSTATEGSYDATKDKLTISDILQTRVSLPSTLKDGQKVSVVMNVFYEGTSGFRMWTTNGSGDSLSNIVLSSDLDLSKQVTFDLTATEDCNYFLFKGPNYMTNIDNLVVNMIAVKYGNTGSTTELDKSYSERNGKLVNNPLVTNKYLADPTSVVYNDRVYVYGTAERFEFDSNGVPTENKFKTASISVISSSDLVNWTDEGEIDVKGVTGWAGNSWAPSITSKVINGTTYFYLYFANGGNGIGVLRSTSPTGPWEDPLGKALITRNTPNCSNVTWLFDPAVMVDKDGTGYLAFGGGVPTGSEANPKTSRIVKLGADMISLAGDPVTLDPPYLFEDSELNVINGKYVYSYCKNWNTNDGTSAQIAYMTSDKPLSGYTYQGVIVKNPGAYFGANLTSNNHHHMFEFKGKWYILYHTMYLENQTYGTTQGYRCLNLDEVNVSSDGKLSATMTYEGVKQVGTFDPYAQNKAVTFAWNGGIKCAYDSKASSMVIDGAKTGNWTGLSKVAFGETGTKSVSFNVATSKAASVTIMLDAKSVAEGGTKVGTVQIANGSSDYRTVFSTLSQTVTGTHDVFFIFDGENVDVASWKFDEIEAKPKYILGDVNGDGLVDAIDGVLIKQYLADYSLTKFDEKAADINGDGIVDVLDGVYIMKYLAGYEDLGFDIGK